MRRVTDNTITLHPDATAAQNNTSIQTCSWSSISDELRFKTDSLGSNPAITINRGDHLYFYTHATTDGGDFRICDFTAAISSNNVQLSAVTNVSTHTNLRCHRVALGDHNEQKDATNTKVVKASTAIGSSATTFSPWDFSHLETVASVTDSPKVGTVIFSDITV